MSPRRRTDKLGPALDVEALLARAESGNLPLASDEERRAWLAAWGAQHPGHYGADALGRRWVRGPEPEWSDMPASVARRDAITYVEVILPLIPAVKRSTPEDLARAAWAREHPRPPRDARRGPTADELAWERAWLAELAAHREAFDVIEQQAQAEAAATREFVIRRFKLAGLVRVAPVPTLDDPAAPSPAARAEPDAQETP